ncbi:hypothetical protein PSFL107428_18650 [Pseudoalteromonas maricaloris]
MQLADYFTEAPDTWQKPIVNERNRLHRMLKVR